MPFCPTCGKEYTQGTAFCQNCGNALPGASSSTPTSAPGPTQQNVKYCQKCGAVNAPAAVYCQSCGELNFGPMPPAIVSRPTGVAVIGILQIIGSVFTLAIGVAGTTFFGPLGLVFIALGLLTLFFGISLFTGKNWARTLMLIAAILDIISIVGVIWGAILLWYLTRPRVVAYFKQPK